MRAGGSILTWLLIANLKQLQIRAQNLSLESECFRFPVHIHSWAECSNACLMKLLTKWTKTIWCTQRNHQLLYNSVPRWRADTCCLPPTWQYYDRERVRVTGYIGPQWRWEEARKGWRKWEREKALNSRSSIDPNRFADVHSWRQTGSDDRMKSVPLSFLSFVSVDSHLSLTILHLFLFFLYIFTSFPPSSLSLSLFLPLPPGHRKKAGQTAPQGKKRWEEIFLSFHRFFLSLLKAWHSFST